MTQTGGKRRTRKAHSHQKNKSKKHMHKGRNNSILKSWVAFVKKVQKEENIGYRDAMLRAKARKSEWKKGMMGGTTSHNMPAPANMMKKMGGGDEMSDESEEIPESDEISESNITQGGRRKHRTRHRRRSSRRH